MAGRGRTRALARGRGKGPPRRQKGGQHTARTLWRAFQRRGGLIRRTTAPPPTLAALAAGAGSVPRPCRRPHAPGGHPGLHGPQPRAGAAVHLQAGAGSAGQRCSHGAVPAAACGGHAVVSSCSSPRCCPLQQQLPVVAMLWGVKWHRSAPHHPGASPRCLVVSQAPPNEVQSSTPLPWSTHRKQGSTKSATPACFSPRPTVRRWLISRYQVNPLRAGKLQWGALLQMFGPTGAARKLRGRGATLLCLTCRVQACSLAAAATDY